MSWRVITLPLMSWRVISGRVMGMSRWAPDAALRLERAAMELFASQGYAETSVPEIAQHAGLTTRTFFRHFTDKREVLFLRERELPTVVASLLAEAPESLTPIRLVMSGFEALAAGPFQGWRPQMQARHAIISSNPALRERELLKNAILTEVITDALTASGIQPEDAIITARCAVMIFEIALFQWLADDEASALIPLLHAAEERLASVIAHERIEHP
jgi:AcrR family transcriptional regulator